MWAGLCARILSLLLESNPDFIPYLIAQRLSGTPSLSITIPSCLAILARTEVRMNLSPELNTLGSHSDRFATTVSTAYYCYGIDARTLHIVGDAG